MAGKAMKFTASFAEIRVDWLGLKTLFSFGGWNALRMCFKCAATQPSGPCSYHQVGKGAFWRKMRMTSAGFIHELVSKGRKLAPLLSLPGFLVEYIVVDVLHTVDLGSAFL